jgi:hypothetical protein
MEERARHLLNDRIDQVRSTPGPEAPQPSRLLAYAEAVGAVRAFSALFAWSSATRHDWSERFREALDLPSRAEGDQSAAPALLGASEPLVWQLADVRAARAVDLQFSNGLRVTSIERFADGFVIFWVVPEVPDIPNFPTRLPEYMNTTVESSGIHAREVARTADYLGGGRHLRGSILFVAIGHTLGTDLIVMSGGETLRTNLP